jgi:hypothetical protein
MAYLLPFLLLVGGAYLLVGLGLLGFTSPGELWYFATERAQTLGQGTAVGYGSFSPLQLPKAVIGIGNLFVGEVFMVEFLLARTNLFPRVLKLAGAGAPQDYVAIDPGLKAPALFLLLGVIAIGVMLLLAHLVTHWRRLWQTRRGEMIINLTWIATFGIVLTWYTPEARQWWLFALPPLCLMAALAFEDARQHATRSSSQKLGWLALIFVGALFIVNFWGSILPLHDPQHNADWQMLERLRPYVRPDDLVIVLDRGEFKNLLPYLAYFNENEVMGMLYLFTSGDIAQTRESYRAQIADALSTDRHVYALGDVFDSEVGYYHIAKNASLSEERVRQEIADFFSAYQVVPGLTDGGEVILYEIVLLEEGESSPEGRPQ